MATLHLIDEGRIASELCQAILSDCVDPPARYIAERAIRFAAERLPYEPNNSLALHDLPSELASDPEAMFGAIVARYPDLAGAFVGVGTFVSAERVPAVLAWVRRRGAGEPVVATLEAAARQELAYWEATVGELPPRVRRIERRRPRDSEDIDEVLRSEAVYSSDLGAWVHRMVQGHVAPPKPRECAIGIERLRRTRGWFDDVDASLARYSATLPDIGERQAVVDRSADVMARCEAVMLATGLMTGPISKALSCDVGIETWCVDGAPIDASAERTPEMLQLAIETCRLSDDGVRNVRQLLAGPGAAQHLATQQLAAHAFTIQEEAVDLMVDVYLRDAVAIARKAEHFSRHPFAVIDAANLALRDMARSYRGEARKYSFVASLELFFRRRLKSLYKCELEEPEGIDQNNAVRRIDDIRQAALRARRLGLSQHPRAICLNRTWVNVKASIDALGYANDNIEVLRELRDKMSRSVRTCVACVDALLVRTLTTLGRFDEAWQVVGKTLVELDVDDGTDEGGLNQRDTVAYAGAIIACCQGDVAALKCMIGELNDLGVHSVERRIAMNILLAIARDDLDHAIELHADGGWAKDCIHFRRDTSNMLCCRLARAHRWDQLLSMASAAVYEYEAHGWLRDEALRRLDILEAAARLGEPALATLQRARLSLILPKLKSDDLRRRARDHQLTSIGRL